MSKKCKQCGVRSEGGRQYPIGYLCSDECRDILIKQRWQKEHDKRCQQAFKEKKKAHAKQKRDFYLTDIKTRKAAAKNACHAYIRERDKNNEKCICCDLPLGKTFHAGHFLESGNHPFIRYDERNINGQNVHCNKFKGGDSGGYERNLRIKIGDANVDYLEANKNRTIKRTADDYKEIEDYYKKKLKEIL